MMYWQKKTIAELPPSKAILEVACGTGIGTEYAARKFPNAKIIALDLSPKMVKIAQERLRPYKNVTVIVGNVEHLSFKRHFDAVFCTSAFHHFPNPKKAMHEIRKVAKKGSTIAITDVNIPPLTISNIVFKLEPGFIQMYSYKELHTLFENAGIKIKKQKRIGLFALMAIGTAK